MQLVQDEQKSRKNSQAKSPSPDQPASKPIIKQTAKTRKSTKADTLENKIKGNQSSAIKKLPNKAFKPPDNKQTNRQPVSKTKI